MKRMYYSRSIDVSLSEWAEDEDHKPLLLRGARQVGKSSAVRHLGERFRYYAELNFEAEPELASLFEGHLDVHEISAKLSSILAVPIKAGETLLFLDEIQVCPRAIESLRFFRESYAELHVIAAGSLLEFTLEEIPSFAVGRVRSLYVYPMTFDEFLVASGNAGLLAEKKNASPMLPLDDAFHNRLQELFRTYLMVGGMPEAVAVWIKTGNFTKVARVQDDIVSGYETDYAKYKRRVSPDLLRLCVRAVVHQIGQKFVYSRVSSDHRGAQIKEALRLLTLAGLIIPVIHTAANGLPLDSEADSSYTKYLYLDSGLLMRQLYMETGDVSELTMEILTSNASDLVNKGALTEMLAGLEWLRYSDVSVRKSLYYWVRTQRNSVAEVDYLILQKGKITPLEIKAGVRGGMKSMYLFMEQKGLSYGIRSSLENFGSYEHAGMQVDVVPLYALSNLSPGHRT